MIRHPSAANALAVANPMPRLEPVTRGVRLLLPLSPRRAWRGRSRHFVSSMPAPVASGWSDCRVGLAPAGKAPLCHGARGHATFSICPDGDAHGVIADPRAFVARIAAKRRVAVITPAFPLAATRLPLGHINLSGCSTATPDRKRFKIAACP